jgi:hypothetical protein
MMSAWGAATAAALAATNAAPARNERNMEANGIEVTSSVEKQGDWRLFLDRRSNRLV